MKWEVRTMRSGTSFFDLTIYRKTVSRFWPLWAVNLVVWLFILPFNGLVTLMGSRVSKDALRQAIVDCGMQESIRGERLSFEEFANLTEKLRHL